MSGSKQAVQLHPDDSG